MTVKPLYLLAATAIIGCASHGMSRTGGPPRRNNLLPAFEVLQAHADVMTAYDAVARLRPSWMSVHGVSSFDPRGGDFAMVFVEGQLVGGLSALRNIPAYQVAQFRYYDVTEAGATFGLQAGTGGVIEVKMK